MTNADDINIPIRQHVAHGANELNGNLEVLSDLIRLKPEISGADLLPEIHPKGADAKGPFYPDGWTFHDKSKNADAVINMGKEEQWVVDFKRLQGNGKHIAPHLEKAAQQADYAVIKLSDTGEEGKNGILRTIERKLKSTNLKGVIVINKDGSLLCERYKNTIGD